MDKHGDWVISTQPNCWVCPYFTQRWVVFNPAFFRVLKAEIASYPAVCFECSCSVSSWWPCGGDFWRRPNGSVASERQTAAISRRRVVFIVQLEAGISTCNHLLQVWASFGEPAMGSQSSAVRDELFDLHIVQEQETPGASSALRLHLSTISTQGELLHLVHSEKHIQRYRHATWRRLPVCDGCSRSHESHDLFVAPSDGDRTALFCEERLNSHK